MSGRVTVEVEKADVDEQERKRLEEETGAEGDS
jgi:hypothetical protein